MKDELFESILNEGYWSYQQYEPEPKPEAKEIGIYEFGPWKYNVKRVNDKYVYFYGVDHESDLEDFKLPLDVNSLAFRLVNYHTSKSSVVRDNFGYFNADNTFDIIKNLAPAVEKAVNEINSKCQ